MSADRPVAEQTTGHSAGPTPEPGAEHAAGPTAEPGAERAAGPTAEHAGAGDTAERAAGRVAGHAAEHAGGGARAGGHVGEHAGVAGRRRPPVVAVILGLTAVLTVLLIAFAWPAARSQPRDLPLAVAGPEAAVAQVSAGLEKALPGGFDIKPVADRGAAVDAIKDRDVYGAIVLDQQNPEVLTASAGGPAVAQILTQLSAGMAAQEGGTAPKVTDIVPLPKDDPRSAGLAAGALPLVLGGIIGAAALIQLLKSGASRVRGAIGFAITGALALTAVLQYWLGSFEGNYFENASVIALSIGAISLTLLGLEWLLGPAGLALGGATMMLLGNPLSGLASAPEMLPTGWGTLGQFLPPGAAGTALRSVSFFDGAGSGRSFVVLGCWLVLGFALCGLGAARGRSRQVAVHGRTEGSAVTV